MTIQKRPLTGMISSGVAAPRAISNVAPVVLHTLDQTATQQGGTYVDQVTLFVQNPTAGDLDVTVIVAGAASIVQTIKSKTAAAVVLDNVPMQAAPTGAATITGQGSGAGLVFWGSYARPL